MIRYIVCYQVMSLAYKSQQNVSPIQLFGHIYDRLLSMETLLVGSSLFIHLLLDITQVPFATNVRVRFIVEMGGDVDGTEVLLCRSFFSASL